MSIVNGLKPGLNSILGIRDNIGAAKKAVSIVTRTWSGLESGSGTAVDVAVSMLPSPRVVDFKQSNRIMEGGAIKAGDILLKMVSKATYTSESQVDGSSASANIEKLFDVGGVLYRVISVTEEHLTWNIQLRQLSDQTRY